MSADIEKVAKKVSVKKIIIISILAVISVAGILVYNNFNQLLSDALLRSFNSSVASDVYELKFENLSVNIFDRTIKVYNVTMLPREKPLNDYPYINSSFRLKTERLILRNVELFTLLESSQLKLQRISITKPDVELLLTGKKSILMPFKDSTATLNPEVPKKKFIESFFLSEFQLVDASFHVTNENKQREFQIRDFNISLYNLFINQKTGRDLVSLSELSLAVGGFSGNLTNGPIKKIGFENFNVGIDSLKLQMTKDTSIFHFDNLKTGFAALDIQTADSLFHLTLKSFDLSYKERSIRISEISFKPNISDSAMQTRFKYTNTQASGTVGSMSLNNVNFDSLIYYRALSVGEVIIDKPIVSVFKDNTKPVDKNRIPIYFGQQVKKISMPLWIGQAQASDVYLTNTERKRDSTYAKVTIQRGTAIVKNITNQSAKKPLILSASAYIENKVYFDLTLGFSYSKPQFTMNGKFSKFDLPNLNPVIEAYTPAKITSGVADEINFSGTVYQNYSAGTMKFLFHDLSVDLNLPKKAKWKSSVVAFAANTVLHSSNPAASDLPPRIVKFRAERDMNKGFINIIIKSALHGLKETMLMSKENKKAYREAKKQMKKQNK